jgi:hypothetical protein
MLSEAGWPGPIPGSSPGTPMTRNRYTAFPQAQSEVPRNENARHEAGHWVSQEFYSAASATGAAGVHLSTGLRAARVSSRRRRGAW